MIADYLSRQEIAGYVGAVRAQLEAGTLDEHAAHAALAIGHDPRNATAAVLAALPEQGAGDPSSGGDPVTLPFFSRDPAVSLLQSSLEVEARKRGIVHEPGRLERHVIGVLEEIKRHLPERFSTRDPEWV